MRNVGIRLPQYAIDKLNERSRSSGETLTDLCRNAILHRLGLPPEPSESEHLAQISDRLSRIEQLLGQSGNLPSESWLQGSFGDVAVHSDVQDGAETEQPLEIVHHQSLYTNADGWIACPNCGSLNNDWLSDVDADQEVRSLKCQECDRVSLLDVMK
jgi:hypothetical protein